MSYHVKCPCCKAEYDMPVPPEVQDLQDQMAGKDFKFITCCRKCAMPIEYDGTEWRELPTEVFSTLPDELKESLNQTMSSKLGIKEGPPTEDEFFLKVHDNPAGHMGAPIIHKGPPQWERMKYMAEVLKNQKIAVMIKSIRIINGMKPTDD